MSSNAWSTLKNAWFGIVFLQRLARILHVELKPLISLRSAGAVTPDPLQNLRERLLNGGRPTVRLLEIVYGASID